ncbi:MAG TPA: T9SS type A sorting domain-containing protein [Prolixibacteraceae bacterium]|nr:T9SS type A sorting domain-containing protein [Prolixibacteraceae bacterium]
MHAATPVASIVLSDPAVSNYLTHFTVTDPANEPYTIQTTKDGVQCRQIPEKKYGYFNVDDATISSTQNNLIFYITFFDEGTGSISLQYNANDGNNYKPASFSKTGTNSWITATVAITNASFRNAQNNKCDFRISGSGNNYLKEIAIGLGTLNPEGEPVPNVSASAFSEFTGKSVAGYQVWFAAGNAASGWVHWSGNTPPSANKTHFEIYPDVAEYAETDLAQTALANLGNGSISKLFTSANKTVIEKHFQWMKEYGIDGVAVQRFIGNIGGAVISSPGAAPLKIKQAAEATGRIFYICYDISSTGMTATWDDVIKFDWVYNVEQNNQLTSSPAYAKVGNKPVVQVWGPGFTDNHPGTAAETIALIEFLKSRGCYVIGGTPTYWRTNTRDAKGPTQPLPADQESFENVYLKYDMISPWMPGRFKDNAGADNQLITMMADKIYCDARNIKYMPVIFPGFSWSQWNEGIPNSAPRNAGELMWRQARNIKSLGVNSMYFAMFDEYDEGTAIMKAATDWSMIPTDQYFLTTSADGIWCSSDFQLRVAGAAIEMLKGARPVTTTIPVPYSNGPVFYRNSFEKRTTVYNYVNGVAQNTGTFNIDPCFYNPAVLTNTNVVNPVCDIQTSNPRSGLYSVKASGTISSNIPATFVYKAAEVKIAVNPNMKISFWKKTENELGRYLFVDLITKSGKRLSTNGSKDQSGISMNPAAGHGTPGTGWEQFACQFGNGTLTGDTITGIVIAYDHTGSGTYSAWFDDFLIEEGQDPPTAIKHPQSNENRILVYPIPSSGLFNLKMNLPGEYRMAVYDLSGNQLMNRKSDNTLDMIDLTGYSAGSYILSIFYDKNNYIRKLVKQ